MNLLRFFKREKAAAEPLLTTAVLPRPIVEKPASERFGKTVMPNTSRVFETSAGPVGPGGGAHFSLGHTDAPKVAPPLAPASERTIALQLADVLPQIPADLVQPAEIDAEQRLVFKAAQLERGMANGRPAVSLRTVYQQAPALFREEIAESDPREIALPFQKVLEQFANFQVRVDQVPDDAVPEVETPFLKVTQEDSKKFGTSVRAVRPAAPAPAPKPVTTPEPEAAVSRLAESTSAEIVRPVTVVAAAAENETAPMPGRRAPIRLSLPAEPAPTAAPVPAAAPTPVAAPALPKILPHGAGVPIPERVPASSGSSAPISLPSPLAPAVSAAKPAPAAPVRIPFKVTPPASDLCPPPSLPLRAAPTAAAPLNFSENGPRLKIPLRTVLRGIPPFQLSGPIDHVPEDAVIELPFAIVQPQLPLGRVAISPAQFHAAMPAEYRALYKLDEGGVPVSLPLSEILRNLPNESLQIRIDQEDVEVAEVYETPFSQKAAEDAARMKTPVGPIAKPAFVFAPSIQEVDDAGSLKIPAPEPGSTSPNSRNPLQVALDTDDLLDAKSAVAHASRLPGVKACAVVFSDGLSLAGNIPDVYETDALCAMAPEIMKRMGDQMNGVNLGDLRSVTLFCEKAPVSFFAHQNICLAVLHATSSLSDEVRIRLGRTTQELAQMYAQPQLSHA